MPSGTCVYGVVVVRQPLGKGEVPIGTCVVGGEKCHFGTVRQGHLFSLFSLFFCLSFYGTMLHNSQIISVIASSSIYECHCFQ